MPIDRIKGIDRCFLTVPGFDENSNNPLNSFYEINSNRMELNIIIHNKKLIPSATIN